MNALALLVFTLAPGLQEPEDTVAGRVLDELHKPLAAVKVVFVHRTIPFHLDAPLVLREAVTDAKGLFRTKLPVGPTFSAWASWDKGATTVVEGVTAKSFVTLVQDPGIRQEKIRVTGAKAWARFAPLSFRVVVGTENLHFVTVTRQGDELLPPPLPRMPYRPVEVLGKDGTVLWVDRPAAHGDRNRTLALPPLADVKVVVLDENRKPIVGAEVRRHIRNYWYTRSATVPFDRRFRSLWPVVGATDQDGKLSLQVPLPAENHRTRLHFMVRHVGYRASVSGWYQGKRYRNAVLTKDDESRDDLDTLTFDLQKAPARVGRLFVADTPYEGRVALKWMVKLTKSLGNPFHETVLASAAGKLACPEPPDKADLREAWAYLPNGLREQVAKKLGAPPTAAFSLTQPASVLTAEGATEPFLDMRALRLITADGRPAERALVIAAPVSTGYLSLHQGTFARTDRLGRALIPKIEKDQLLLVVTSRGWVARRLPPDNETGPLTLNLQPRPTVAGRVVDEDGSPVAGVYVANASLRSEHHDLDTDRVLKVLPTSVVGYVLNLLGPMTTDRDGRFRYPLLPVDSEMRVGVVTDGWGTVPGSNSDPFSCAPGDKLQPVVLKYPLERR